MRRKEKEEARNTSRKSTALKAVQAIIEREDLVARLEGEKQSLEKVLEDRSKQQVQGASELQITMMETMEAVELEKQKHNNTRMEALARLAKLESADANLTRSLANIQKNLEVEVETLSSEKAMLLLRIEAVSRMLDEYKATIDLAGTSSRDTLESGAWQISNSKLRYIFKGRMQSGQRHFGSLVRQLDSLFCVGAMFLRRNSTARIWSIVYLVCLHLWVTYILMSHSPVSDNSRHGAVFSLENISNTGGV